jgi:hypothetical protein
VSGMPFILMLLIINRNNELNKPYFNSYTLSHDRQTASPKIDAFTYTCCDPNENGRPVYSVRIMDLSVENNRLGTFRTGLYKVMKITNLELLFYQYTFHLDSSQHGLSGINDLETAARVLRTFAEEAMPLENGKNKDITTLIGVFGGLIQPKDGWRINLDISNTTEVLIDNFDYKVFRDGNLFFELRSKKASLSCKQSGLLLRGHVTITTADGSTLECNNLRWNIDKGQFVVKGTYLLNSNGIKTMGRDIRVDAQLNDIKIKHATLIN